MLNFTVNQDACTGCGECADDCPARIIDMDAGQPIIAADKESSCYKCQHCLAVCPTGAISILGLNPEQSFALTGDLSDPALLETLIKGRRSVRRYTEENLDPDLLHRLLEVASYAPSGMNARQVRFTVVDDREKLARLRDDVMAGLGRVVREKALPEGLAFFADFVKMWEEKQVDIIFRGAPHFLVASAPQSVVTPVQDCLIALSYFDLFAQSLGVGTLWDGIAKWAVNDILPEFRTRLKIPDDHVIGYAMVFGRPAVRYARTVQHSPANIHLVS